MISINRVRNIVMFLLEKENKGYIKPIAFNEYVNMAVSALFEEDFFEYTKWVTKRNVRQSNSGYSDIVKNLLERIEIFSETTTNTNFTYNSTTNTWNYSGNDFYRLIILTLIQTASGKRSDIDQISKLEMNRILNSNLTQPSLTYPNFTYFGDGYKIYPTVPTGYSVEMNFIRKPKLAKWTYFEASGNPMYNPSASDFQDIELHDSLFTPLVQKVLFYCGISLREDQIIQASKTDEALTNQIES